MRKWQRFLVIGIAALLLAGLVVVLRSHEREPEYQGKKLSEWLAILPPGPYSQGSQSAAVVAIRNMKSDPVPFLLGWSRYEAPLWQRKLSGVLEPIILRLKPSWKPAANAAKQRKARASMYALVALGPRAEAAAGELAKMLPGTNNHASACIAPMALASIGKAGLPYLVSGLTNQQTTPDTRCRVGNWLWGMGTNARPAIPALRQALTNPDPLVRSCATRLLEGLEMGRPPSPFLIEEGVLSSSH